jgi:hypothetical protein
MKLLFSFLLFVQISTPSKGVEVTEHGKIDWVKGIVTAKGYGAFDPKAKNLSQEILKARRVAIVVAQRNLLETIKGVHITSETIVENYILKSDLIFSRVQGIVKNARMIGEPKIDKENGIVEVELAVNFFGEDGFITPILPEVPKKKGKIQDKPELKTLFYTGAVIDASGAEIKPAVFPKFYDEKENLLLDTSEFIDPKDPKATKVINFVNSLNDILSDPELSKSALVIKIKSALNKRDFVVGKKEAEKLKWLKAIWRIGKKIVLALF